MEIKFRNFSNDSHHPFGEAVIPQGIMDHTLGTTALCPWAPEQSIRLRKQTDFHFAVKVLFLNFVIYCTPMSNDDS
ncbi:hypothetical protein Avbf_08068 [Armadillidium vulgare]|nr:hypothetical protein Avbf_08068 [Armadillidium vulgare]